MAKVKTQGGGEVELELFKFDTCPFCVRVQRKIDELGIQGITYRDTRQDPEAARDGVRRCQLTSSGPLAVVERERHGHLVLLGGAQRGDRRVEAAGEHQDRLLLRVSHGRS